MELGLCDTCGLLIAELACICSAYLFVAGPRGRRANRAELGREGPDALAATVMIKAIEPALAEAMLLVVEDRRTERKRF